MKKIRRLTQSAQSPRSVVFSRRKESHMHPDKPKIPVEAIELYTRYIHGEIGRRDFLNGVKRFAVAGLTTGAIVEAKSTE